MNFYGRFEEFVRGRGYPSIRSSLSKTPYKGKERILRYLRSGKYYAVYAGHYPVDTFTGKRINIEPGIKTDGDYAWPAELEYYVSVYNLRLSQDFENRILNK